MKRRSLLAACGMAVSLALSAPVFADQQAKRPHHPHAEQTVPHPAPPKPTDRQTVPRGDLRGDIASNARERALPQHAPGNLFRP
jgi:Tfp pilus assembly protein FimV